MNNGSAIARLTGVFTVCLLLLGYNVYGGLFKSTGGGIAAADTLSLSSAAESTATAEKTESLGESTPEKHCRKRVLGRKQGGGAVCSHGGFRYRKGQNYKQLYIAV